MNTGLFISQNLFEGLLKGISCQKVKEGVVCSSLNSAGELKEIYSDFLNMLAEITNCEEMPLSICTSLEEIKELIAIQRFFETKSNEVLQESNSLSVRPLIAQNQKRSDTEKIPDNLISLQTLQWNSNQTCTESEENVSSEVIKDGRKCILKELLQTILEDGTSGGQLISEKDMAEYKKLLFNNIEQAPNLSQAIKGRAEKSDIQSTGRDSLRTDINTAERENGQFEIKGNLPGWDDAAGKKPEVNEGSLLKSNEAAGIEKLRNIIEHGTSSAVDADKASDTSTGSNERFLFKGTVSTASEKCFSGMTEDAEIAADDLNLKGMQGFKKGEYLQGKENEVSLKNESLRQQNDQIQTENNFSKASKNVISVNGELPQEDYVLKDYVNPNIKDGLNPETRALNLAEPLSSGENTSIRNEAVADDETVFIPRAVNMGKPVVADKGDEPNLKSGKSGYDDVEKSNSIPERLIFEDILLKKEKAESKPDNKIFESEINHGNDPDKAPRLSRFNSNNRYVEEGNIPSKVDNSGREITSKNEVEIQGPSVKGERTHEITRIPVDKRPLNKEPDIKDAHVLSSSKNSSETTSSQVSQTKNSDQLQRPLQLDLLNKVVEKAVVNLKNGQTSINIDLKPEYLGRLRMHISTVNNQVVVKVLTDVPLVKEIMETNLSQLKTELQNHGLEIEKFDVFLNDGSNQDSAEHERWLFGKTESRAKEIIKPVSISDEITPLVVFSESGRVNGRIDCMA